MGSHFVQMKTITPWIRNWISNWWPSPRRPGMSSWGRSSSLICLTNRSQRANKITTSWFQTTLSTFSPKGETRITHQSENSKTSASQMNCKKLSKSFKRRQKTVLTAKFCSVTSQTRLNCNINYILLSERRRPRFKIASKKTRGSWHSHSIFAQSF